MRYAHHVITLLLATALAGPSDAEVKRLDHEMTRLAQKGTWKGVDRKYAELELLKKVEIPGRLHLLGAQAARHLGDMTAAHDRATRALSADPLDTELVDEASRWLADFLVNYGEVAIELSVAFVGAPRLVALDGAAFDPKVQQAMTLVEERLQRDRKFRGFIPLGRYRVGDTGFDVYGGPCVDVFVKPAKEELVASAGPAALPGEGPPDRLVTLAVRGGGWNADAWDALAGQVRDTLYGVDGVMAVDAFQPESHWVYARLQPEMITRYDLDLVQLAGTLQLALDVTKVVAAEEGIAFPPGTVDAAKAAGTVVAFEPGGEGPPRPVKLSEVASIHQPATGPFPMPRDTGAIADYRFEIRVRGGSEALAHLMPALEAVEPLADLGLTLEGQEAR